jgi:hypothetical protein
VPSVTELTILAVVVGIRIVLSWSLSKEINRHVDIKASENAATALQNTNKQKDNYNAFENRKDGDGGSNTRSISEA